MNWFLLQLNPKLLNEQKKKNEQNYWRQTDTDVHMMLRSFSKFSSLKYQ